MSAASLRGRELQLSSLFAFEVDAVAVVAVVEAVGALAIYGSGVDLNGCVLAFGGVHVAIALFCYLSSLHMSSYSLWGNSNYDSCLLLLVYGVVVE